MTSDILPFDQPSQTSPTGLSPETPAGTPVVSPVPTAASATPIGRIPIIELSPVIEGGRWPAKAVVGEAVPIRATVFREGHDAVAASAVLLRPDGTEHTRVTMTPVDPGLDHEEAWVVPDAEGRWSFRVEGWSDPYGTWLHDAPLKVRAGVDVELMLTEGALLLERAAKRPELSGDERTTLHDAVAGLRDTGRPAESRLAAGISAEVHDVLDARPVREQLTLSASYPMQVDRERALYGSWYEFFPRSEGARFEPEHGGWISGTLQTAAQRLPGIAAMGFDVAYLTPIHPIGTTNRKGRNNTVSCREGDPGSPYGIGSPEGGHDAIHPELGTFADFADFVARARAVGMEVALDLALQASPDHPWVTEHPQWFNERADGTIAYAENPPKKYQDIYPLNFDNDPEGIYVGVRDVIQVWIDHGVTIFRVDNPHTKPLDFWQRILTEFRERHPEVIFLAEAFTRPAMMHTLGAIGFHQSYTYFTWRTEKEEISEYLLEVSHDSAKLMRPAFWPTTHDILTPYMQTGGASAFAIRAVLAATGSPTWGIYSGYEFVENVARPGAEEQIDNEKYEFKPRDWPRAEPLGISQLLTMLNSTRAAHPALQRLRGLVVHPTSDDSTVCFSRHLPAHLSPTGQSDTIIVVLNLDPFATREGTVTLDLTALGVPEPAPGTASDAPVMAVTDELSDQVYYWPRTPFVRLDPHQACAHVLSVRPL